jgi:hypothetical protein
MSDDQISTAGDLMDYLATQPRDRKVILQKDGEGNGFSPLAEATEELYAAESSCSGYIVDPAVHNEEEGIERVVVLGPVN